MVELEILVNSRPNIVIAVLYVCSRHVRLERLLPVLSRLLGAFPRLLSDDLLVHGGNGEDLSHGTFPRLLSDGLLLLLEDYDGCLWPRRLVWVG